MLLWLWCRLTAIPLIRPLAWEPPYAMGVALEKAKNNKERKKERKKDNIERETQSDKSISNDLIGCFAEHKIRMAWRGILS